MSKNRSPGGGSGSASSPRFGDERAVLARGSAVEQLVERRPRVLALDLDARLLADPLERLAARALEAADERQLEAGEARRVGDPRVAASLGRWRAVIPATSDRSSSRRRCALQSTTQRQTSQCSTGSGYVASGG